MQKVVTAEEMREIDRLTTEKYGIPSILLMENAAHATARIILEKFNGSVEGKSVLVLCGKGNNGGDGAALARILWTLGAYVSVNLIGKIEETKGDARINFKIIKDIANSFEKHPFWLQFHEFDENQNWASDEIFYSHNWDCFIDSVFGTGLDRSLSNRYIFLSLIDKHRKAVQSKKTIIVSLDIPSGLKSDLAKPIGENIKSDLTVTFTAPKLANVFPPASNFNGKLHVVNIGSPQELIDNSPSKLFVTEKEDVQNWLWSTDVQKDSYKKTRGTALIIAGSEKFSGAASLAANVCFASGCGMVSVAVPKSILPIVASKTSDEIIVENIEEIEFNVDVVGIGCGLSSDEKTKKFVREMVENRKVPMVLDAEALNALSPFDLQGSDEFPLILTPHIGEFRRLLGREISDDKIAEVREFVQKHNVILILKGERSLIAKPDGTVVINPTGNAGISRAGAGDSLTGIITSFLAQTFARHETSIENAFKAVISAVYVAGLAGDIAAKKFSERLMTATDVRDCLQIAIDEVRK
jgi:NAD(P)H-hydrate epimerase